jgi:hypothetical protein
MFALVGSRPQTDFLNALGIPLKQLLPAGPINPNSEKAMLQLRT